MNIKKITILLFICIATFTISFVLVSNSKVSNSLTALKQKSSFRDGDLIFQSSQSEQCEAVRIATNSKYSHCGIIFKENGKSYVYEAIQPVKKTLLSDWIQHGLNTKYVVARLKDSTLLNKENLAKMKKYGEKEFDKDYDIYFEWSDEKIYCSEYVWKIYKFGANIELCKLEKLKSFNLENPKVKAILKQRYGNNIPLNEDVVAPSQLADSDKVTIIFNNY